MAAPKKPLMGKQLPTKPATDHSPLHVKIGTGPKTWTNLTRRDVEEKMGKHRQQQAATNQRSLWQRLASVFRKSSKSD